MQESRQARIGKLAQDIARKRRSLWEMKFMQKKLKFPSSIGERHATIIREMSEELQKVEAEYHDLNVEQIREELKSVQSRPIEVLSVIGIFHC